MPSRVQWENPTAETLPLKMRGEGYSKVEWFQRKLQERALRVEMLTFEQPGRPEILRPRISESTPLRQKERNDLANSSGCSKGSKSRGGAWSVERNQGERSASPHARKYGEGGIYLRGTVINNSSGTFFCLLLAGADFILR